MLAEIDRLTAILSTYDAASEISRVMRGEPVVSNELAHVLDLYRLWTDRTAGALHLNLGAVTRLWQQAAVIQALPTAAELRAAFAAPRAYNIDALGKGFIIDRAVEVARRIAPAGLLNIGGDLRAWGNQTWTIGVANPFHSADNAPAAATFQLRDAAVTTSGSYLRSFVIAGVRFSHLIDPRTLWPITDLHRNATVRAADCVTSNAISTAMCVLGPTDGAAVCDSFATGRLCVGEDVLETAGDLADATPTRGCTAPAPAVKDGAPWPKDFRVEIPIVLKAPGGQKVKRPYVAVWVEDSKGKPIRNIAVWGNRDKYIPDLSTWFKLINGNLRGALAFASATRAAGTYTLYWDGKSDAGVMMPQGSYKVRIEINREHGQHAEQSATVKCGTDSDTATAAATAESDESKIEYKKAAKN